MRVADLDATLARLTERLLAAREGAAHWTGELSSSALSTATASIALALAGGSEQLVEGGLRWLERTQNEDGGWGDTVLSISNISTTALCWAAFTIGGGGRFGKAVERCEVWLTRAAGSLEPEPLSKAIASRYGRDQTFSVPILTVLAIAGKVPWGLVPQLPFELAAFPRGWYRWLGLPVVSYALPALIAIGHVHHRLRPAWNPLTRTLRGATSEATLRVLEEIQPENGGYLEATPLTSFVTLSLLAAGYRQSRVLDRGLAFLRASVRADGSWPIDTNLSTWVTTLAVNALRERLPVGERAGIVEWLLGQQYREVHPYTGAPPGCWAWTDLPGGVPDADDTSGAVLALHTLGDHSPRVVEAATAGIQWLLDLQNRDGGIPTFCRGWGKLPFDRSSPDITAHALQAWVAWKDVVPVPERAVERARGFLRRAQRKDGAWVPLWFGNQHAGNDENPVYGTARVLCAIGDPSGMRWLLAAQNSDGGWGGDRSLASTIEETAVATAAAAGTPSGERGARWLIDATQRGERTPVFPLGFYFARLWYYEKLYPLIFAVDALRRVRATIG